MRNSSMPRVSYVISSVLVMGGYAVVASWSAGVAFSGDLFAAVGAFLVVPLMLFAVAMQFRATFHGTLAASAISTFLPMVLLFILYQIYRKVGGGSPGEYVTLFLSCVLFCHLFESLRHVHRRFLKKSQVESEGLPESFNSSLRLVFTVLGVGVIGVCLIAPGIYVFNTEGPCTLERATAEEAEKIVPIPIPKTAKDISCSRSAVAYACEFSIDEAGFIDWAKTIGISKESLESIIDKREIFRYISSSAQLTSGLYFSETFFSPEVKSSMQPEPIGSRTVAYDRANQRAYYFRCRR